MARARAMRGGPALSPAEAARAAAAHAQEVHERVQRKTFALQPTAAPARAHPLDALTAEREAQARGRPVDAPPVLHAVARAQEALEHHGDEHWMLDDELFELLTRPPDVAELDERGVSVRLVFGEHPCPLCHADRVRGRDKRGELVELHCVRCDATWSLAGVTCFRKPAPASEAT